MNVLVVQAAFGVVAFTLLGPGRLVSLGSPALRVLLAAVDGVLVLAAFHALWCDRKARNGERSKVRRIRHLIARMLHPRPGMVVGTGPQCAWKYPDTTAPPLPG